MRNKKWTSISHNMWIVHKEEPSLKVRMQKSVVESQNNVDIWNMAKKLLLNLVLFGKVRKIEYFSRKCQGSVGGHAPLHTRL